MKRYFLALALLVALLFPLVAEAGIYGVLKGKVTDAETGEGLIGATVQVMGTSIGTNVTNKDGSFTLTNINSGTFDVKFSYVGMKSIIKSVRISADKTSTLDAQLKSEYAKGEQIDIVAERLIRSTDVNGNETNISKEQIVAISGQSIADVVSMAAGVQQSGSGFQVRGTRTEDTQVKVDGQSISNPFTGGLGNTGVSYAPIVSQNATEEVQVLKGGYSAEYGESMGGVVNTIPKSGRTDVYSGYLDESGDIQFLYGQLPFGVTLEKRGSRYYPVTGGEGANINSPLTNKLDFGIGGPIPILKNSQFYFSGWYMNQQYPSASYQTFDPAGNDISRLPDQGLWVKQISGKLTFGLSKKSKLIAGGNWGLSNGQNSSWGWLYANDLGTELGKSANIKERVAKQIVSNNIIANFNLRLNQIIDDSQFYELTLGYTINSDQASRRSPGAWGDPGYFTGFDLILPQDNYKLNASGTGLEPGKDRLVDQYTSLTETRTSNDGYIISNFPAINPLTGFYEGDADRSGTQNPWGLQWYTISHGNSSGFQLRDGFTYNFEGNYTKSLESGDFTHYIKAGLAGMLFEMHRDYNSAPWDGNSFRDVFTDKWGGNIYFDANNSPEDKLVIERTSKPWMPLKASGFLQDQIVYKGIIISGGLRFDYFMPNSLYRLPRTDNVFTAISGADSLFAKATNKFQISPRVNITYPITEESFLRITYGLFFEMPLLQSMYDGFGTEVLRAGNILGNPNLDAQRTNKYEVNYSQQIGESISLSASVFYDDVYNQLGVVYIPTVPSPYFEYSINEYGNSRGLEFEFTKTPTQEDHIGINLNYTISWIEGTSDGSTSNANAPIDPYSGKTAFPLATYPLGRDIRNRVKGVAYLNWADNQGPSIGGIQPLENSMISFNMVWRSGAPYTKSDKNGNPLGETNALRFPSIWALDLRLMKSFYLRDWFGEGFKKTQLTFYIDVTNLLNRRAIAAYYPATSDPIDDGLSLDRTIGQFSDVSFFKTADYANAQSYSTSQYDNYGNRLYSEAADYNRDGIVTREESYQSYLKYLQQVMSQLGNYQYPRTAYGGIKIVF